MQLQSIFDILLNNLTKSNITFAIAVISFILTFGQLLCGIYTKRTNFTISAEKLEKHSFGNFTRYIFTFMVQNLSSSPVSITRMKICDTKCLIQHQWIGEKYYPKFEESDIPITERLLSTEFPVNLIGHDGKIIKVIFDFPSSKCEMQSPVTLKIMTNKKSKSFTFDLPEADNDALYL